MPNLGKSAGTSNNSIEQAIAEFNEGAPLTPESDREPRSIRFNSFRDTDPLPVELLEARGLKPARDFTPFRFWQDRHNPQMVAAFEEQRRQWRAKHDEDKR